MERKQLSYGQYQKLLIPTNHFANASMYNPYHLQMGCQLFLLAWPAPPHIRYLAPDDLKERETCVYYCAFF